MSLASLSEALLAVGVDVAEHAAPRIAKSVFVQGAKVVLANGGLSKEWAALSAHRYADAADIGVREAADIIAAVDPALGPIAHIMAPVIIWAIHHPDTPLHAAMDRAEGPSYLNATWGVSGA